MEASTGRMIITSPTQTGDTPHIAAALALASKTGAFLVYDADPKADDPLLQFYQQAAKVNKNPVLAYRPKPVVPTVSRFVPDPAALQTRATKSLYAEMKELKIGRDLSWTQNEAYIDQYQRYRGMTLNGFPDLLKAYAAYTPLTVSAATTLIADEFRAAVDKKTVYTTLAKAVASTLTSEEIIKDMPNWKLKTPFPFPIAPTDKPILLVWSRYTGQNSPNGYNPAGDSDPKGQEQLYELGRSLGFWVVAIGHGPDESRKSTRVEPDCHLGEFYKNKIIESKGRAGQMSFFLALLERCPGKIIQIGQKTGGMDSAALLGMPTLYIEDEASPTATRMIRWIDAVPFYQRAFIKKPPTPLGRTFRELTGGFEEPESQSISPRFRVLTWVWMLLAKSTPTTQGHLTALETAIGKKLPDYIFDIKYMLDDPRIKEEVLLAWLDRMQKLNPQALETANIQSGYSEGDLEIIKKTLSALKDSISKPDSIVRNTKGVYVKLSEVV